MFLFCFLYYYFVNEFKSENFEKNEIMNRGILINMKMLDDVTQ